MFGGYDPLKDNPPVSPFLAGLALLAAGALIRSWEPSVLKLPSPEDDHKPDDAGVSRAARLARDGLAAVLPRNLTRSVARSMIIVGAGLIMVRALDELVDDEESLF